MNRVTILMPVFNCERYVEESLRSILNQSYYEFDLLIIDDASKDSTLDRILSFDDKRIKLVKNKKNMGVASSLNRGMELINSEYIIRADSDDICCRNRISKQLEFMDINEELGLSGTWFEEFGNGQTKYCFSDNYEELKIQMLYINPIGHPTVIFRSSKIKAHKLCYKGKYKYCEDYELWSRCVNNFPISNLKEILLLYRRHDEQVSTKFYSDQNLESLNIKINQIKAFIKLTHADIEIYSKLLNFKLLSEREKKRANIIKDNLIKHNELTKKYNSTFFEKHLNIIFNEAQ